MISRAINGGRSHNAQRCALAAFSSSINPVTWGRGIMIDLGLGGALKFLERHLGLLIANIVAGCIAAIAMLFVLLMLIQVCQATEGLILSAAPYRVTLGVLMSVALVVAGAFIPYVMRAHYFRIAVKNADEHLQRMYNESHEKMRKDAFIEKSQKLIAQMKAYNDKLET